VPCRIERLIEGLERFDPQPLQPLQELLPNHLDTVHQRVDRTHALRRIESAVEVVDDVEQLDKEGSLSALDLLAGVAARTHTRLIELGGSPLVLFDVLLQQSILLGQSGLELFDVRGLAGGL
jgi:hypothetical protein